jgi:RNA polymerase sigma-70 factor (ECF subfamily)
MGIEVETALSRLLRQSASGDRVAFAELYRLTAGKLLAVARRIAGNAALSEDALQEAYVRIWSHAARFDPTVGSAMTWMITIVRNEAISLRRRAAERIADRGVDLDDVPLVDPAAMQDANADLRRLRECLNKLNEQSRSMVLLAYHLGASRQELAARFDRPVATVKTVLRRGLASLKECLDGGL